MLSMAWVSLLIVSIFVPSRCGAACSSSSDDTCKLDAEASTGAALIQSALSQTKREASHILTESGPVLGHAGEKNDGWTAFPETHCTLDFADVVFPNLKNRTLDQCKADCVASPTCVAITHANLTGIAEGLGADSCMLCAGTSVSEWPGLMSTTYIKPDTTVCQGTAPVWDTVCKQSCNGENGTTCHPKCPGICSNACACNKPCEGTDPLWDTFCRQECNPRQAKAKTCHDTGKCGVLCSVTCTCKHFVPEPQNPPESEVEPVKPAKCKGKKEKFTKFCRMKCKNLDKCATNCNAKCTEGCPCSTDVKQHSDAADFDDAASDDAASDFDDFGKDATQDDAQ